MVSIHKVDEHYSQSLSRGKKPQQPTNLAFTYCSSQFHYYNKYIPHLECNDLFKLTWSKRALHWVKLSWFLAYSAAPIPLTRTITTFWILFFSVWLHHFGSVRWRSFSWSAANKIRSWISEIFRGFNAPQMRNKWLREGTSLCCAKWHCEGEKILKFFSYNLNMSCQICYISTAVIIFWVSPSCLTHCLYIKYSTHTMQTLLDRLCLRRFL